MKVLHVVSYGYVCGGAEKSVLLLKQGLTARGHDVRVVSSDRGNPVERFADYTFPEISPQGLGKYAKHLWYHGAHTAVSAAIKDFQPDVVHFHTMGEVSPAGLFALGKTPALMTVHGPEEYTLSSIEWTMSSTFFKDGVISKATLTPAGRMALAYFRYLQRPLYLLGMKNIRLLLAPSQYMSQKVVSDHLGVPIRQVYNGIPLPALQPPIQQKHILFIGRLERVKGVQYLLDAFNVLSKDRPDIKLTIAGDGRDRITLERHAKKLGLQKRVAFLGWVDNSHIIQLYQACTVLAIPSIVPENLPTTCIEALAVGRPVVASRIGGLPEMIADDKTGKLVKPGDAAALAAGLSYFLNKTSLDAVARQCNESAQRFALDTFLATMEAIYAEMVRRPSDHS